MTIPYSEDDVLFHYGNQVYAGLTFADMLFDPRHAHIVGTFDKEAANG